MLGVGCLLLTSKLVKIPISRRFAVWPVREYIQAGPPVPSYRCACYKPTLFGLRIHVFNSQLQRRDSESAHREFTSILCTILQC